MRTKSFDVPPQEVLTKDSVTVTVDAVIYYKVRDANGKSYLNRHRPRSPDSGP